jgi:hypothetical protein
LEKIPEIINNNTINKNMKISPEYFSFASMVQFANFLLNAINANEPMLKIRLIPADENNNPTLLYRRSFVTVSEIAKRPITIPINIAITAKNSIIGFSSINIPLYSL